MILLIMSKYDRFIQNPFGKSVPLVTITKVSKLLFTSIEDASPNCDIGINARQTNLEPLLFLIFVNDFADFISYQKFNRTVNRNKFSD
jgi:hypothetical protein